MITENSAIPTRFTLSTIRVWQQVPEGPCCFFRAIRSFRKNRPYAPEVIHRILRQAAGGTSEQEHTLPDVLWKDRMALKKQQGPSQALAAKHKLC